MLVDSYSEIKEFWGIVAIDVITEANEWMKENGIIATSLICSSHIPFPESAEKVRWYVFVTYNVKEPLNAVGEAAKERMPKDIPYFPKGKPEGARHH